METLNSIAQTLGLNSTVGIQLIISLLFLFLAKHFFLKDLLRVIIHRSKNTVGANSDAEKYAIEVEKMQQKYDKLLGEQVSILNKKYDEERKKISDQIESEYKNAEEKLQRKHEQELQKMEQSISELRVNMKNSTKELSSQLIAKLNL